MNHDDLLARVRDTFQALDPVPAEVLAAARSALAWRRPGAELAELADDGAGRPGGGVRGAGGQAASGEGGARALTFTAGDLAIEMEIETQIAATGPRPVREHAITGRLVPAAPAQIRVRHLDLAPGGPSARTDQAGHFTLSRLPEGLVSLLFRLPGGTSVVTSWIRL
jgi:hypothetical protein